MRKIFFFVSVYFLLFLSNANAGTFVSGSTGADGAFNPPAQVPLGTIVGGNNVTVPLPPNGIFNFTTVDIPSIVTVTFQKNAANTPVYILATGDVTIAGAIKLDGGLTTDRTPGTGGPGGYDGGWGGVAGLSNGAGGKGLGPGGGGGGLSSSSCGLGCGGGFGTTGGTGCGNTGGGASYGNARLIPLIGGSGGGGADSSHYGYGGGGGGGAILIASSGTITISGFIAANGGDMFVDKYCVTGSGSGGAVKLIANTISGAGSISAKGGISSRCDSFCGAPIGGSGRIRIEAFTNNFASGTNPAYSFGLPSSVFVPNQPSLSITSIGGVAVPSSPTASYASPDIKIPGTTTNPVTVALSASNIPVGTTVTVSVIPQQGSATDITAILSGTDASSTASAHVNLSVGSPYIIAAQTTFTLQTAMFYDGEKIEKVRVASNIGKASEVTYITESGKEISAEKLLAMR